MLSVAQNSTKPQSAGTAFLGESLVVGGNVLANRVFLAPMSGISDLPFRNLAAQAGAGLVVSEMVASQEFVKGSGESRMRAQKGLAALHMVQLAGRDAYWMGEAARVLEANGADVIDINMGCPAKKVTGGYSGSALMRDLDHAMTLIVATVEAVNVPVTLKMRLGWDFGNINAPELASRACSAGIAMITVHGRTRCQFYDGKADWSAVRAVREAVEVPLVVNGDICNASDAMLALELSGADAVMIGRAHYGQPWLAGALASTTCKQSKPADLADYIAAHYEAMLTHYGTNIGVRHARKHLAAYLERHADKAPAVMKSALLRSVDPDAVISLIGQIFRHNVDTGGEMAA